MPRVKTGAVQGFDEMGVSSLTFAKSIMEQNTEKSTQFSVLRYKGRPQPIKRY